MTRHRTRMFPCLDCSEESENVFEYVEHQKVSHPDQRDETKQNGRRSYETKDDILIASAEGRVQLEPFNLQFKNLLKNYYE